MQQQQESYSFNLQPAKRVQNSFAIYNSYRNYQQLTALKSHSQQSPLLNLSTLNRKSSNTTIDESSKLITSALSQAVGVLDGYGDFKGLPELRELLAQRQRTERFSLTVEDVLMTHGVQLAYFLLIGTLLRQGEELFTLGNTESLAKSAAQCFGVTVQHKQNLAQLEQHTSYQEGANRVVFVLQIQEEGQAETATIQRLVEVAHKNNLLLVLDASVLPQLQVEQVVKSSTNALITINDLGARLAVEGINCGWITLFAEQAQTFASVKQGLANLYAMVIMPNTISLKAFKALYEIDENILRERHAYFDNILKNFLQSLKSNGIKVREILTRRRGTVAYIAVEEPQLLQQKNFILDFFNSQNVIVDFQTDGVTPLFIVNLLAIDEQSQDQFAQRLANFLKLSLQ